MFTLKPVLGDVTKLMHQCVVALRGRSYEEEY